jgi:glycosyltransferase involved in cell wall biosynthesis
VVELNSVAGFKEFRYDKNTSIDFFIEQLTHHSTFLKLIKLIRSVSKSDVILLNGWAHLFSIAVLFFGGVFCSKKIIILSETMCEDKPRVKVIEFIKKILLSNAHGFLVGGYQHAKYLQELGIKSTKIEIGYDVVDNTHFNRVSNTARRENVVLCVGRFIKRKRFDKSIDLLKRLHDKGLNTLRLKLIGDGPEKKSLFNYAYKLGVNQYVDFEGFKSYEELPDIYSSAIVLLHLADNEPWGLVVNEAMASGCVPVVSTHVGAASMIVNGASGIISDDIDDIAKALELLLHDSEKLTKMSNECRKRIAFFGPELFESGIMKLISYD